MKADGLVDAGYKFFNIDDCWLKRHEGDMNVQRPPNSPLVADPARFPKGMEEVSEYVRNKGMEFGIYSDAGSHTCQGYFGSPEWAIGMDVKTFFNDWHSTYLKLDGCHMSDVPDAPRVYDKWSSAIRGAEQASGHNHIFSCSWPAYWLEKSQTTSEKAWHALRQEAQKWISNGKFVSAGHKQRLEWFANGGMESLLLLEQRTRDKIVEWVFNRAIVRPLHPDHAVNDDDEDPDKPRITPKNKDGDKNGKDGDKNDGPCLDPEREKRAKEDDEELKHLQSLIRDWKEDFEGMKKLPWDKLAKTCDLWRLYGDISNDWGAVKGTVAYWARHQKILSSTQFAGAYHDPDMLVVGNKGVSSLEGRSQMSMWAVWGAPLIMGHDLRSASRRTTEILTHKPLLSLQQNNPGVMGRQTGIARFGRKERTMLEGEIERFLKWKCPEEGEERHEDCMYVREKQQALLLDDIKNSGSVSFWRKPLSESGSHLLAVANLGDHAVDDLEVDINDDFLLFEDKHTVSAEDAPWTPPKVNPAPWWTLQDVWDHAAAPVSLCPSPHERKDHRLLRQTIKISLRPHETLLLQVKQAPAPPQPSDLLSACMNRDAKGYVSPATIRDIEADNVSLETASQNVHEHADLAANHFRTSPYTLSSERI